MPVNRLKRQLPLVLCFASSAFLSCDISPVVSCFSEGNYALRRHHAIVCSCQSSGRHILNTMKHSRTITSFIFNVCFVALCVSGRHSIKKTTHSHRTQLGIHFSSTQCFLQPNLLLSGLAWVFSQLSMSPPLNLVSWTQSVPRLITIDSR